MPLLLSVAIRSSFWDSFLERTKGTRGYHDGEIRFFTCPPRYRWFDITIWRCLDIVSFLMSSCILFHTGKGSQFGTVSFDLTAFERSYFCITNKSCNNIFFSKYGTNLYRVWVDLGTSANVWIFFIVLEILCLQIENGFCELWRFQGVCEICRNFRNSEW